MKKWVSLRPNIHTQSKLAKALRIFSRDLFSEDESESRDSFVRLFISTFQYPQPPLDEQADVPLDEIFTLSSSQIAQQISLATMYLYKSIPPHEFVHYKPLSNSPVTPNLSRMIDHFNRVANWCASAILSPSSEKARLHRANLLAGAALEALDHFDYNTAVCLGSAFQSVELFRLVQNKVLVSKKIDFLMEKLIAMRDRNSNEYRNCLKSVPQVQACIPYVGLHLQDMLFIYEQFKKEVNEEQLSWAPREKLAEVLKMMVEFQRRDFSFAASKFFSYFLYVSGFPRDTLQKWSDELKCNPSQDYSGCIETKIPRVENIACTISESVLHERLEVEALNSDRQGRLDTWKFWISCCETNYCCVDIGEGAQIKWRESFNRSKALDFTLMGCVGEFPKEGSHVLKRLLQLSFGGNIEEQGLSCVLSTLYCFSLLKTIISEDFMERLSSFFSCFKFYDSVEQIKKMSVREISPENVSESINKLNLTFRLFAQAKELSNSISASIDTSWSEKPLKLLQQQLQDERDLLKFLQEKREGMIEETKTRELVLMDSSQESMLKDRLAELTKEKRELLAKLELVELEINEISSLLVTNMQENLQAEKRLNEDQNLQRLGIEIAQKHKYVEDHEVEIRNAHKLFERVFKEMTKRVEEHFKEAVSPKVIFGASVGLRNLLETLREHVTSVIEERKEQIIESQDLSNKSVHIANKKFAACKKAFDRLTPLLTLVAKYRNEIVEGDSLAAQELLKSIATNARFLKQASLH